MTRRRIALYAPPGNRLEWSILHVTPRTSRMARKELRRLAEETFGRKWHALWLAGYRVRACDAPHIRSHCARGQIAPTIRALIC